MRLANKVALITGGSQGIGRSIAERYAREGAKVAICGRGVEALQETVDAIEAAGGVVAAYVVDVQNKSEITKMIDQINEQWGAIDVLVSNAGICQVSSFLEISEEDWDRHMAINLKGTFLVCQRIAIDMVNRGVNGSIIIVSSVNGLAAEADQAHYNTTKGGMNSLMMSMALELAPNGIRVNALCPGFIDTRLTRPMIDNPQAIGPYLKTIPMGRIGQPDEMAASALFLASDDSSYMTGHCMVVDGGQLIKLS